MHHLICFHLILLVVVEHKHTHSVHSIRFLFLSGVAILIVLLLIRCTHIETVVIITMVNPLC